MSVPVRYSAAANYAVVDNSGLTNTLTQEEQYHQFQQQQQQQQQQLYCQFVANNSHANNHSNNINECNFNGINGINGIHGINGNYSYNGLGEQQQLMQQRSSMSSSVSPAQALPANINININNIDNNSPTTTNNTNTTTTTTTTTIKTIIGNFDFNPADMDNYNINDINLVVQGEQELHHHYHHHHEEDEIHLLHGRDALMYDAPSTSSSSSSVLAAEQSELPLHGVYAVDDDDESVMMKPMASTMAAAAAMAGTPADGSSGDSAAMQAEWRMSDDEGRYGIPGAAGLEYQKYELEQQQRQQTPVNKLNNNIQPMEPSLMDNENRNMKKNNNNKNTNKMNPNANGVNNQNTNSNTNSQNVVDELSAMSTDELYRLLKEYDVLQDKYHTVLLLPREAKREVTAGGRDGSAYVLRCLKMWYELPSDVLFSAMSLVDRFLDRMAVKPKHMACMSVASFHLAIKQLGLKPIPAEDLVTISQCGCTAGDLERMAGVIANKLGVQMGVAPVTSVTILRVFYVLFRELARSLCPEFFDFYQQMIKLEDLENRLENLLCDVKTTVMTPSTLALVLMCLHMDFHIKASYPRGRPELKAVFEYILYLQQFLRVPDRVFTCGFSIVADILSHYNGQNKQPYKQRLVWKLSSRTLKVLRPTNRFTTDLATIEEGMSNTMDEGCRSRTESISSEEEEDWPTSPIIPIFEQC